MVEALPVFSLRLDSLIDKIRWNVDIPSNPLIVIDKTESTVSIGDLLGYFNQTSAIAMLSQGFSILLQSILEYLDKKGISDYQRFIKMIIGASILSLCGWMSPNIDQLTENSDLLCSVCGREISLTRMRDRCFDPIMQHRPYCAWICGSQYEMKKDGWEMIFDRVFAGPKPNQHFKSELRSGKRKSIIDADESPERLFKRVQAALKDAIALSTNND